ncbi:MAG: hypothetical protein LBD46_01535 [Endomicrobium sp.]|jgi:hypothetical protein|nr:hypothetical protein [Endomicrobium sp.]
MAKIIKKIKNKTKDTCIQDKISRSRVKWFFAIILILLPIAYCFIFIYQYGINIPYNDEFLFFPFLEKVKNHNVTFLDFFEDINSHRIVIPKIIAIINMVLFDYNSKINMLLFFAFLCFTYALICAYLCNLKCFSRGGGGGFAIILFCAFMIFTKKQY